MGAPLCVSAATIYAGTPDPAAKSCIGYLTGEPYPISCAVKTFSVRPDVTAISSMLTLTDVCRARGDSAEEGAPEDMLLKAKIEATGYPTKYLDLGTVILDCYADGGSWQNQSFPFIATFPSTVTSTVTLFSEEAGNDSHVYLWDDKDAELFTDIFVSGYDEIPIPTSTYDGTFSELLPSFSWSVEGEVPLAYGRFTQRIQNVFGQASETAPVCYIMPFFGFLDLAENAMTESTTSTGMIISGGIVPTTTLAIDQTEVDEVLAGVGFAGVWNIAVPIVKTVLWLVFGVWAWRLFTKGKESEETL